MKRLELVKIHEYYEHVCLVYSLKRDRESLIIAGVGELDTRRNIDGMSLSMYNCAIEGKEYYIKAVDNMPEDSELKQCLRIFNEMCDFFEVSHISGRGKIVKMLLKMIEEANFNDSYYADMNKATYDSWKMETDYSNYVTKFKITDNKIVCMDRAFKIRAY